MSDRSRDQTHVMQYGPQIVGLLVFVVALWAQVGDAYVGRFLEDGLNLVLAKAIARGEGLSLIQFPADVPARWVHPLYPFTVSLVGRVWPNFPDNLVLIQILDSALLGCAAWVVCLHIRKLDFSPTVANVVVVLGFSSASILSLAVSAFAEPMFLALAAGAVLQADRQDITRLHTAVAGALAGVSALTGNLGVFVIAGIVAALAVRKEYGHAVLAAFVATAIALPWFVWTLVVDDPTGLAANAVETARLAAEMNGVVSWQGLGPLVDLLLQSAPQWAVYVLGPIAAGFFGVGILSMFASAPALIIVVSACTAGAWLHPLGVPRNEWILFPWFLVLLTIGAWRAWGYARQTRVPVFVAFAALSLMYVPRTVSAVVGREFAESLVDQNDFLRLMVMSINAELPEDVVIASDADAMVHLYTGRLVIPARRMATDESLNIVDTYCAADVSYLVRTRLSVPGAVDERLIERLGPSVTKVFDLTDGPSLYRFACPR